MEDDGLTVYDGAELTPARVRFWLALDGWQADEAAHLLCCIDPRALNRWAALNAGAVAVSFPAQFGEVLALLQRAGEAGALLFPAAPGDVIRWAMSKGLRLPAPLIPAGAVVRGGRWTDEATKAGESLNEPAPGAVAASGTHKVRRRADPLAAVLKLAGRDALDGTDWQSVWAALVALAEPATRPPPLLGYVEGEGVQYRADDADQPAAYLTREALRKRFKRKG